MVGTALNLSALDAVIVDLDGTMVDTMGDFELALNRMLADLGLPSVARSFIERTVGKGSEHLIRSTLQYVQKTAATPTHVAYAAIKNVAHGVSSEAGFGADYEAAWQSYQSHYLAINGQASAVYAGVHEGLAVLQSRGLKLACLTNKPLAFARPLLQAKGLEKYFSQVFGGDSFARKKPDPLPLLKTCEALATQPARTLMLGDSANDALAARAAGCPVVLVTYGYNHGEPIRAVDADGWLDSLAQLR